MKENDMEDLFKEKFEDFEPEVDSKVWEKVKTGLKVAGAGVIGNFLVNKLGTNALIAIASSLATVVGTLAIMNWTGLGKEKTADKQNVIVVSPKPTVEEIKEFLNSEEGLAISNKKEGPKETNKSVNNKFKNETIVKAIKPKSIASIQASQTSGEAPLIVDVSNGGKGKKNTWILGDKQNNNDNPAYFFDVPGVYTLKLESVNDQGQSQIDSIKIEVFAKSEVDITKFSFTPNGDGKNDSFGVNPQNIINIDAQIYDKEGNMIYKWSGIDGKWGGQNMKGESAKAGTYYYILNSVDAAGNKTENKGTVKLIR